ncbi:hypothetical protein [Gloeocapsopsis sp. IPPAS B-1203]|uniref:hypothetical protein n=1 Tax=Gloeocapsopsis sp. IPPAS B-1203 TaxID=2049454 RepID=UPI000C19DB9F|nr:hypothetical protein [Gloeocapsopsis sp. IPPAS B-1203]PIG90814.1 hypothetical protein CSQ79_24515 [Gloeocapsopsis sp. IPPAS B-1203]
MSYDFEHLKVPVFTGVNDNPIEPTANKAGNGSHLIKTINDLIDETTGSLNELQSFIPSGDAQSSNNWKVINADVGNYYAQAGDKVVIVSTGVDNNLSFYLPNHDNRPIGAAISLIKTSDSDIVEIAYNGKFCNDYPANLYLADRYKLATVIWSGDDYGWIPNDRFNTISEIYNAS